MNLIDLLTDLIKMLISAIPALGGVTLGWFLSSRSQKRQRGLENISNLFEAQKELIEVASNIPPDMDVHRLHNQFRDDSSFMNEISRRIIRLFGIRRDYFPYLEADIRNFIDSKLQPLYVIKTGSYKLRENIEYNFAVVVSEFRSLVNQNETNLIKKYNRLSK